ncbi:hypothetical protein JXM83_07465 [Candidatus Woesearchaeota archaeon]|nr:hypothetical protein [Candidatus Woesearchaeota archaeon]
MSNYKINGRFVFVVLLLFILVFSLPVFAEEDKIFTLRSPDFEDSQYYLLGEDIVYGVDVTDVEDVTFYTKCLEDSENRFEINTNLTTYRVSQNTFLTQFRQVNATCQELELAAKFIKNDEIVTLSKIIRIVYYNPIPSMIVDSQLEEGSWNEHPLSTAYAIFALSRYEESFSREIDFGMRWLKENRGEDDKCWEKDECTIDTTAKIHALLWLSEYDDTYRIMHNSRLWLIDKQNIIPTDGKWKFILNATDNFTQCIYNNSYDGKNETIINAITLNDTNHYVEKIFTPVQGEFYDVLCTRNISVWLYDHDNILRYNGSLDNLSYQIPNKCWDDDYKWNLCDYETTGFALMSDIPSDKKSVANTWLTDNLLETSYGAYLYTANGTMSENVLNTALYLHNNPSDTDVVDWLLFNQNNDGSWGNDDDTFEDKLEVSVYAILALQEAGFDDNDEPLYDAKKWIYSAVPYGDWDTVMKSSLAHVALSTFSKHYLEVNPRIIEISDSPVNVELYNPTPYKMNSLTFSFTENLGNYLEMTDVETISSDTYKVLTLKAKDGIKVGDYYGTLLIKDGSHTLNEIPVLVGKKPILRFTYENNTVLFGPKGALELTAEIDDATYECDLSWFDPEISGDAHFTLTAANPKATVKYVLDQAIPEEKSYVGEVACVVNNKKIYNTISITIKQYKTQPFDVSESLIAIDVPGYSPSFNVTNKIDEPLKIEVSFKNDEVFFEFDNDAFTLEPGQTMTVTVMNLAATDVNVSSTNVIIVQSKDGVEKRITFTADVLAVVPKSFNFMIFVYLFIALIVGLLLFMNFFLVFRKSIIKSLPVKFQPGAKKFEAIFVGALNKILPAQFKLSLEEEKPTTAQTAGGSAQQTQSQEDGDVDYHVADMVDIMRSLSKSDTVIRKELEQEGFSQKQIAEGIKEADKLAKERDEKSKKKSNGPKGQVGQ